MPNTGFKGTEVLLSRLTLMSSNQTPVLAVEVQFASPDGTVHAVCEHSFPLLAEEALGAAATELVRLITQKVESLHYAEPRDVQSPVLTGIAETLRSTPRSPDDEPGTQG